MVTFANVVPRNPGLFSRMPTAAPWSGALTPARMDVRARAQLGNLEVSSYVEAFADLDGTYALDELAASIYEMYASNWKRLWDSLLAEYDILHPNATISTQTRELTDANTETRNLSRVDAGTTTRTGQGTSDSTRTGGMTDTTSASSSSKEDTTGQSSESRTGQQNHFGVGGSSAIPADSDSGNTSGNTSTGVTGSDSSSGQSKTVFDNLRDAGSTTNTDNESRNDTVTDSGTVANAGNQSETIKLDSKGASTLHTHQDLVSEEVLLRTGVAHQFLDLVIRDVQHETCARIWVREGIMR